MRIGIDVRTLRDDYPGIGRYVSSLLLAMREQLEGDELVAVHDPEMGKSRYALTALAAEPRVKWAPLPLAPRALQQQWKLPAMLRELRLDVFHSPYYVTAYRGLPCPLVVSLFDLIPIAYPASMPSAPGRLAYRLAVRLALRAARRVIVCSRATAADLARLFGTPGERVEIIPGAAAPVFTPATAAEVRRVRELHRVPPRYILHVGVNKPHKNLETLLAAYHRYYTQTGAAERASLVLVGRHDPRYVSPRRWAAQLGFPRAVLALGEIPDEDLRALYSGASAVAVPSHYEGFGLPALEAMACGAPVLASTATALPEVAGDAAMLLDPRDPAAWAEAMGRVVADGGLQADLRARGLARAAQFSWQASARRTLQLYRSLGELR